MNRIVKKETILSIAIPTYNRAVYLDKGLKNLSDQYRDIYNIEIIVCDNASPDNTKEVVAKYQKIGLPIVYYRNKTNIGPDKNIQQCYLKAIGKYVLVMGDDDILANDAIKIIYQILTSGVYGIVYLNFYGFLNDPTLEKPVINTFAKVYEYDAGEILKMMRSNISFTSSNIVNRSYINEKDIIATTGTNLNQMPGVISAALNSAKNVYIGKYLLAQQTNNSGGYDYLNVFGSNFINVANTYLEKHTQNKGYSTRYKKWLYQDLVINLFPQALYNIKKTSDKSEALLKYKMLDDLMNEYFVFRIFNSPIIWLPTKIDTLFLVITKIVRKIMSYYYQVPFGGRELKFDK